MDDINDHFVILHGPKAVDHPLGALLTREANVGLTLGGRINKNDEKRWGVELIISHAWVGSVFEKYRLHAKLGKSLSDSARTTGLCLFLVCFACMR